MMKLHIGISSHNKQPEQPDLDMLKEQYFGRCDCCGIPTEGVESHPLWLEDFGWQNACELCYYTCNLDRNPSLADGVFIFCPRLTQQEVNVLCRLSWAVNYHLEKSKVDIEVREAADTLNIIMNTLHEYKKDAHNYFTGAISNVKPNVAYLNLLDDERYAQRKIMYENLRWLPEEVAYKSSTRWYATEVFNQVSVHHLQSQVEMFMSRITKG